MVNKSLPELFFDYNNGDLACTNWTRFVITLTVLFGQQETYTAQQIRFALCGDEPGFTSISDEMTDQIVKCGIVAKRDREAPASQ